MVEKQQTVAAIFALLNDFRLSRKGGNSLGFINPLIYLLDLLILFRDQIPAVELKVKLGLSMMTFFCLFTFAFHFQQVLPQSKVGTQ